MNETSMLGYPNINLNPTDQQQLVTGFGANGSTPGQLHMNMMALGGAVVLMMALGMVVIMVTVVVVVI